MSLVERIAEKLPSGARGLLIKELNEVAKLEADNAFLKLQNEGYRWVIKGSVSDDKNIRYRKRSKPESRTTE